MLSTHLGPSGDIGAWGLGLAGGSWPLASARHALCPRNAPARERRRGDRGDGRTRDLGTARRRSPSGPCFGARKRRRRACRGPRRHVALDGPRATRWAALARTQSEAIAAISKASPNVRLSIQGVRRRTARPAIRSRPATARRRSRRHGRLTAHSARRYARSRHRPKNVPRQ